MAFSDKIYLSTDQHTMNNANYGHCCGACLHQITQIYTASKQIATPQTVQLQHQKPQLGQVLDGLMLSNPATRRLLCKLCTGSSRIRQDRATQSCVAGLYTNNILCILCLHYATPLAEHTRNAVSTLGNQSTMYTAFVICTRHYGAQLRLARCAATALSLTSHGCKVWRLGHLQ